MELDYSLISTEEIEESQAVRDGTMGGAGFEWSVADTSRMELAYCDLS